MTSRRRLVAALLIVTGCGGSSSTDTSVATSITLNQTTVGFQSLLSTFDLVATVRDQNDAPMSATVTWSTNNANVATVTAGRVTAAGNGTTEIIASVGTIQAQATVNVQQVPFSVQITPSPVELTGPLDTEQATATVRDAGGSTIASPSITWSSQNTNVATVNSNGVVTGVATGQTTVNASVATGGAPLVQGVTVNVGGPVTIVTTSLDDGLVGTAYNEQVVAVGGDGSYVWSLVSGSLPAGLTLASNGTISGTPATQGTSNFTVRVDSQGLFDTQALSIQIVSSVLLSSSYLRGGYPSVAYSQQIKPATGGGGSFTYSITAGSLPSGLSINASNGTISGTPTVPGVYFFEVTATSGPETANARYALTISTKPQNAFNLWISYAGGALPPANVITALTGAVARWEQVVTGDESDVTYPPSGIDPGTCSLADLSILNGATIDDVVVVISIGPIDGPSNTLARGGYCGYSRPPPPQGSAPPTVVSGQMKLDNADVAGASSTFLQQIIWHEVGHVMGIGTLWSNSIDGTGTGDPRFTGANAVSQWEALPNSVTGGVPVQPNIEAHWDEGWFDSEIMTPSSEGPAGSAPISRVTIGALIDLGWEADVGAADSFLIPACADTCTFTAPSVPFDEIVNGPLMPLPKPE